MDILGIIATVLLFALMILVHELGHFSSAKAVGMQVHEFALGFGPVLARLRRGETRYSVRAFPLGGFVRIPGLEAGEETADAFQRKPVPHRLGVLAAGPLMNLAMAALIFCVLGVLFGALILDKKGEPLVYNVVGQVMPGTPAERAGLRAGDRIVAVNGKPALAAEQIRARVRASKGKALRFTVFRGGPAEVFLRHWQEEDRIAFEATRERTVAWIAHAWGRGERVVLSQGGRPLDLVISPRRVREPVREPGTETVKLRRGKVVTRETYQIGIAFAAPRRPTGPVESVHAGLRQTYTWLATMLLGLRDMVTGRIRPGLGDVEGPVSIVRRIFRASQSGWDDFLWWSAFISLNIGLLNLLPFPALDGSRFVFAAVEGIRGRPLDPAKENLVHIVGFALLLLFMAVVTFNDIFGLWRPQLSPQ